MATKSKPLGRNSSDHEEVDARGNVRVYGDVPVHVARELKILAIRRGISKQALMAELIMKAVSGK